LLACTYRQLRKFTRGLEGVEVHHLIEKRFRALFNVTPGKFLSIALTDEMHQIITNRWRNLDKVNDIFKEFVYGGTILKSHMN
jgi:hypothetical protein